MLIMRALNKVYKGSKHIGYNVLCTTESTQDENLLTQHRDSVKPFNKDGNRWMCLMKTSYIRELLCKQNVRAVNIKLGSDGRVLVRDSKATPSQQQAPIKKQANTCTPSKEDLILGVVLNANSTLHYMYNYFLRDKNMSNITKGNTLEYELEVIEEEGEDFGNYDIHNEVDRISLFKNTLGALLHACNSMRVQSKEAYRGITALELHKRFGHKIVNPSEIVGKAIRYPNKLTSYSTDFDIALEFAAGQQVFDECDPDGNYIDDEYLEDGAVLEITDLQSITGIDCNELHETRYSHESEILVYDKSIVITKHLGETYYSNDFGRKRVQRYEAILVNSSEVDRVLSKIEVDSVLAGIQKQPVEQEKKTNTSKSKSIFSKFSR